MIQFINVFKDYAGSHQALRNVNFHLNKGEMAFLTGHSGAGKTTLLKLIMLIEKVSRGQVQFDGENLCQFSKNDVPYHRRSIGMIYQNPQLLANRTVFENVSLPLVIAGFKPAEIKRRTHAALDKVDLLKKENCYPLALSSGEQQRVGIARAVVTKPQLLLADEPTGNLDPNLAEEIMKLFEAFNNVGVTVLVATHDLPLIARMNHRILTLKDGQLIGGN
jgi:cell division transport system ATP-binding protein